MRSLEKLGFPGYSITDYGQVFNDASESWVVPSRNDSGYLQVKLYGKYALVHVLTARTFVPNIDNKPFIKHIDGDYTNNYIGNLVWSYEDLFISEHRSESLAHLVCQDLINGLSVQYIAKKYNCSPDFVYGIRIGSRWTNVSKEYKLDTSDKRNKVSYTDKEVRSFCIMTRDFNMQPHQIGKLYGYSRDSIQKILKGRSRRDITEEYFDYDDGIRYPIYDSDVDDYFDNNNN